MRLQANMEIEERHVDDLVKYPQDCLVNDKRNPQATVTSLCRHTCIARLAIHPPLESDTRRNA